MSNVSLLASAVQTCARSLCHMPLTVAAVAMALPGPSAARSDTFGDHPVQIEILDGGRTKDGTYVGALRVTLEDGWKTYWRTPGDAGIPPAFSWRGSRNVGHVNMTWPAPEIFLTAGMRTIGYHDQLVLPVEITPENPNKPVRLKGQMELGICKDVCIPSELSFDHGLDPDAPRNPAIVAALATQPYTAREAGVTSATCALSPSRYGIRIEAHIKMPSAGSQEIAVIEPGAPHLMAGETSTTRQGTTLIATTEFMPSRSGDGLSVDRSELRITVLGNNHAVEIQGCTSR